MKRRNSNARRNTNPNTSNVSGIVKKALLPLSIAILLVVIYFMGLNIRSLKKQNHELTEHLNSTVEAVNKLQSEKQAQDVEANLKLYAGLNLVNSGSITGVSRNELGNFRLETPYPSTLIQVVNRDGAVIHQEVMEGNANINNFGIIPLPEDLAQLRVLGFDGNGIQQAEKRYEFGLTD